MSADKFIQVGRITGVYGVKGSVKVHSYTQPRENVLQYADWTLDQDGKRRQIQLISGRRHGNQILAEIAGIEDRDQAAGLIGAKIFVSRSALPACGAGEYYWADLEGLLVISADGSELGRIDHLIETGAHDVMVLDGGENRLIPFVLDEIVRSVDLDEGRVVVNWDASFWSD